MKLVYICSSAGIVYLIRFKEPWSTTNDKSQDTFLHFKFAVAPCAVLALFLNSKFSVMEVRRTHPLSTILCQLGIMPRLLPADSMDLLHLPRGSGDCPSAYCPGKISRIKFAYRDRTKANDPMHACSNVSKKWKI
jgi:hypothetical protein